jgi:hypothetical protein
MDYDALEQLYGNDNWLLVNGRDSSYLYFSRVNKFIVNTYAYIREKGDSVKVQYGKMQVNDDQVNWILNNTPVHLKSATRTRAVWESDGKDSLLYEFIRIDQDKIKLTYPDKHTVIMEKMLPLSLFLVRSQYDFANGTHYAFDTTQFNRKK